MDNANSDIILLLFFNKLPLSSICIVRIEEIA